MQTNWKDLLTTLGGFSSQSMSQIGVLVFLAIMEKKLRGSKYQKIGSAFLNIQRRYYYMNVEDRLLPVAR